MGSRYEEKIYNMLTREPMTPSEIAKKLGVTYKTAQRALMHLALTKDDVFYRNSGRIHLFWKGG
jgi:Mn-dependent DtxR family transcriptional regulator